MNCINCNRELTGKYATKFCSHSCSAQYNNRKREPRTLHSRKKTSEIMKNIRRNLPNELKEKIEEARLSSYSETYVKYLFDTPFDDLSHQAKRSRIIIEQECKCNKCGLSEWLNEPICFELDHIDGNNKNNVRTNLEILCPNCHSTTPTWKGRKNKRDQSKIYEYIELRKKMCNGDTI